MQPNLYDYSCEKDSSGIAMSKVWKIFQKEAKITKHVQKKHLVFLVLIWRFQHFRHLLQNPKLKQMAPCFSNHSLDLYFSIFLGP